MDVATYETVAIAPVPLATAVAVSTTVTEAPASTEAPTTVAPTIAPTIAPTTIPTEVLGETISADVSPDSLAVTGLNMTRLLGAALVVLALGSLSIGFGRIGSRRRR